MQKYLVILATGLFLAGCTAPPVQYATQEKREIIDTLQARTPPLTIKIEDRGPRVEENKAIFKVVVKDMDVLSTVMENADDPYVDLIQERPTPAKVATKDLPMEIQRDKAIIDIAKDHLQGCEEEQRARTLAWWRSLCMWVGVGSILLALAAFVLILWLAKNLSLAIKVAGALVALSTLSFAFMWILGHLWLTVGCAGGVVAFILLLRVYGAWNKMVDGAKVLAADAGKADEYVDSLAKAKVHNLDSFKEWLDNLRAPEKSPDSPVINK